jgi:hypothetical protein
MARHGREVHPWAIFTCFLCLASGAPLLFGTPPPQSINAALPQWGRVTWGILLFAGSAVVLAGLFWPGNDRDALLVEQVGQVSVAAGSLVYAAAILSVGRPGVGTALAFVLGFGLFCAWRAWRIEQALLALQDLGRWRDKYWNRRDRGQPS